jgi:hypothetical protein
MGLLFGFIILISFDFLISAPGSNSSGCWGLQFFFITALPNAALPTWIG